MRQEFEEKFSSISVRTVHENPGFISASIDRTFLMSALLVRIASRRLCRIDLWQPGQSTTEAQKVRIITRR